MFRILLGYLNKKSWIPQEMFEIVFKDRIQLKHILDLIALESSFQDAFLIICSKLGTSIEQLAKEAGIGGNSIVFVASSWLNQILQHPLLWKTKYFVQFLAHSRTEVVDLYKKEHMSKSFNLSKVLNRRKNSIDDYLILKCIGKGCKGKVMLVREKETSSLFALKTIHKSKVIIHNEIEHAKAERNILAQISSLNHPFLVKLHKSFQSASELFLLFEYHSGGDLATHLSREMRFSFERAKFYAVEMILGIESLHLEGIIYRDLKPENVLLSNSGHIVLTDFLLSKQFIPFDDRTSTFCGTAEYLAPEILLGQPYDFSVDWWSLGIFLYEMLVGITPFWADTPQEMYQRVLHDSLEFPPNFPASAEHLLKGLLCRNPTNRFGIDQIKASPFFENVIWNADEMKKLIPPFIQMYSTDEDLLYFDDSFLQLPTKLRTTQQVIGSLVQNAFL